MRTSHRMTIAGTACIVALMAASPIVLSMFEQSTSQSTAVTPAYDFGTIDTTGVTSAGLTGPRLVYSTYPGGGLTITPTVTNAGSSFTWGNWSSPAYSISLNATDWSGGNSTNAIYTPTTIFAQKGPALYYVGQGVCNTTVGGGSIGTPTIATCPNHGTANAPTVTFTFSQPVTNWSLSINDLGGFNGVPSSGGQTMYADWVVTSGQTLSLVSGNNNIQVTGGNTIKVNSPAATYDNNATGAIGVGAGTILVAGTYSSVSFRLDYSIANTASTPFSTTSTSPPDAMSFQWSLSPAVVLTYDGNGGTCTTASNVVPPGTAVTIAGGSTCSRSGFTFAGWNTAANGTGTSYAAGSSLTLNADTTLYAVWTPVPAPAPAGGGGGGAAAPAAPAAPRAVDDVASTPVNTPVTVNAAANDTYPAGSVFSQTSSPANGSVSWNPSGSYTYTPRTGFSGVDTFTYQVCLAAPNSSTCSSAKESIVVGPLAVNDSATTQMNVPVTVNAAANDTYPAGSVFSQTSSPANGSVSWNANGTYTYTPRPGFTGIDTFTYQVCMPAPYQDRCSQATEFITVGEPDPKATPQTLKIGPGSTRPVMYTPVGLSRPASGSTLKPGSVAIAQAGTGKWGNRVVVPGKGTWILKGTQVQFVPAPGFTGQTTIRYRIQDRNGRWAYSTLTAAAPAIPTVITGGW